MTSLHDSGHPVSSAPALTQRRGFTAACWAVLVVIAAVGIFLRVHRSVTFRETGPDELFYKKYVEMTVKYGVYSYPEVARQYVAHQKEPANPLMLPPLRITFIWTAALLHATLGISALDATHVVACAASILVLFVSGAFAWRLGGRSYGTAVFALMAFAPLQIYSAQRALIDGFFALCAVLCIWTLWENLQRPNDRRLLALYGLSVVALVCTKENAFFVYVAMLGILGASHWLKLGRATSSLYVVTIAAPAIAALLLLVAAGGPTALLEVYRTNVQKSVVAQYAIETGDGPWQRYLLDLVLMDPVVLLLALGGLFRLSRADKAPIYLGLFVGVTYLLMCQVRYGMNLRYAIMWDMPLRWLAFSCLMAATSALRAHVRTAVLVAAVALICWQELRAYNLFFVEAGIYDPVPGALGAALQILKETP